MQPRTIFIGDTPQKRTERTVQGEYVSLLGDVFYKIRHFDAMEPFFMSIVSSSDHWLFISSTGGLTAGRINADHAMFPYYTVDKVSENYENTGSKAILLVKRGERTSLWEPFSDRHRGTYALERNLYKNVAGTAVLFEETNRDLGMTYRYAWRTGEKFGFVKTSWVSNIAASPCQIELVDGLQNILAANVLAESQNTFSCLLDAYKRSEAEAQTGLAMFAINSRLTDLAEPSESLLATTVAPIGLTKPDVLLSTDQLEAFRAGEPLHGETEIRGQRGAYFVHTTLALAANETRAWHLVADVHQDSAAIAQKLQTLHGDPSALLKDLERDIAENDQNLWKIVASADGLQLSNDQPCAAHHFANVMFNEMRGGIFVDQYWVRASDFVDFVAVRNRSVLQSNNAFFAALPEKVHIADLQAHAAQTKSPDLIRLSYAYLPLTFSRRHGDPSRPWNRFAINIKKPDGSQKLDYEGNWRDIFQNWEALAYSYPEFTENMISTFLNATTVDGYNPYRITHSGIDWELPEPNNPWANIGYWSDHQIIYLQKLMEVSVRLHPGKLQSFLNQPVFSYANVPYRIKPYADLLKDPYNTIGFDWDLQAEVKSRRKEHGTDGNLVFTRDGQTLQVSLAEKLLTLLLAKLTNFVPEGGIWMNTQRPEWNDANNALVGKGLSVVTLCYLRRYLAFCKDLLSTSGVSAVSLSAEVAAFLKQMTAILEQFKGTLNGNVDDTQRRAVMDALGEAGSAYRWNYYRNGLSGAHNETPLADILLLLTLAQQYVEHALRANKRPDNLYHSYNILHLAPGRASVGYLTEMLEGQVAILSSGLLNADESLALLESLRKSALYRADQQTYILYPDRTLPGFLEKNCLTEPQIAQVPLLSALAITGDTAIITRDVNGAYHFSGHIRNFNDVTRALNGLKTQPQFTALIDADLDKVHALFEATFRHNEFTGRSGTFFAYEGLGSVYWHMVAKLLLAVQETVLRLPQANALVEHYVDVRRGLSFNKTPDAYGAFPTDPYSHTPKGQGAKQPGMTGLVKEVILARQAEVGLYIQEGRLAFDTLLLDKHELLTAPAQFTYLDVRSEVAHLDMKAGSLAYSLCQTPIILEAAKTWSIDVHHSDGTVQTLNGKVLDEANSRHIFERDGSIHHLVVSFPA